ncbi:D-alanyl-D-alanine carboxypeptidase family protein [Nocardiopsis endophytica]|uniref:D-alanyl-D-alanine carboxypeptidase family protein n=1 Tax=Nocardiopsis endophytica TaxID=3018445 RepID=UPI0038CD4818
MPFSLASTRRTSRARRSGSVRRSSRSSRVSGSPRPGAASGSSVSPVSLPRPLRVRLAQGIATVLVLSGVLLPAGEAAVAPITAPAHADEDLDALAEQAEQAKDDLEKATEDYTEREKDLDAAQEELVSTLHELQQTELKLGDMREPLSQMASTLYQQPDAGALGLMTSGTIQQDLRVDSYVSKLSEDKDALIEEANKLRDRQVELTNEAQNLQAETQLARVELKSDLKDLKEQSEESTKKLTQELEDRGLDVDAYMAGVECDPSKGEQASSYPNGLLPQGALCELPQGGEFLRADAAVDFMEMNQAYADEFGSQMCLTSSYRDLPNQQRVYAEQPPGNAAVPGTSNHGWGLAVDICGGVQNQGSAQFNWLEANSQKWGWFHPQWAYSNPFEPWHWEYKAAKGE